MTVDTTDRTAFRTLLACCVGHAGCHLTMLLFPTLRLVMSRGSSLEVGQIDWAYGVCCLLFGVGAPAAGWLTDRVGARLSLTLFFVGLGLSLGILGAVPGPVGLWSGMILLGLANSIYHPAGMMAISLTQHARRGRSMGVLGIAGSLGIAAGPLVAGVLGNWLGWQGACLVVAVAMLALSVWTWAVVPRKGRMIAVNSAGMARHAEKIGRKGPLAALAFLLLAMTCQGFVYRLLMTSTPMYVESLPWPGWMNVAWIGAITAAGMLIGAGGQVLGGLWSDSASAGQVYPRIVGISIVALVAVFVLPGFVALAALMGFLLIHFAAQPVENVLVAQRTASARRSLGYGMKFVLTFGVGSVAVKVVGILGEQGRIEWVFLCGAFAALLGIICIYAAGWMDRREWAIALKGGTPAPGSAASEPASTVAAEAR